MWIVFWGARLRIKSALNHGSFKKLKYPIQRIWKMHQVYIWKSELYENWMYDNRGLPSTSVICGTII